MQHMYPLKWSCGITAPAQERIINEEVEEFGP